MIKRLRLRNFKSFADAEIEFGPFTLLIGSNGAGKSNLFDALRFLRAIGEGRSVRDAIEGHAPPGLINPLVSGIRGGGAAATHFSSESTTFSLEVTVHVDASEIVYLVEVDTARHRVVSEQLSSSSHPGSYVYSTRPETGPLEQSDDGPAIAARFHKNARGLNPKREFSPFEFVLSQFTSRRAESRVNEEVADIVREELSSIAPLELQPEVLRKYSPIGRFEMGEHGEYFAAAVWKLNSDAENPVDYEVEKDEIYPVYDEGAIARRDAVLAWLSQVTPREITSLSTATSPTNEVIVCVTEAPYEQEITAPSLSDGTLRFAALALSTVGAVGRRTLLIEEIENGINPARISLLIRMLEQTVALDDGVQVIASTHSPAVLDFAENDTVSRAIVIGWDDEAVSSRTVAINELPGLSDALRSQSLGDLQEEGWLQLAAEI
ncbi:AAA family ATPase [Microbacterium jejuense]|uniref:AAA family ATPase n=1 Tax=Microbacterium jejuense TaxID=1263637 RepID=UPI0031E8A64C